MAKKPNLKAEDLRDMVHQVWGLAQDLEAYSDATVNSTIGVIEDPLRLSQDLASAINTLSMLQLRLIGYHVICEERKKYAELRK